MKTQSCSETLDCNNLDLGQFLLEVNNDQDGNTLTNIVNACKLATEKCAHKVMLVLSPDRVLCLTTDCIATVDEVEQMEKMMEEWDDWVRPAICVSIMVTVVIFFSFMYFGRSWMEGTARLTYRKSQSLLKEDHNNKDAEAGVEGGPHWEKLKIGLMKGRGSISSSIPSTRSSPGLSRAGHHGGFTPSRSRATRSLRLPRPLSLPPGPVSIPSLNKQGTSGSSTNIEEEGKY